jgi:hypothetical protein
MPWNLQRRDLQTLTDIVKDLHGFGVERDRQSILTDALGVTARAKEVLNDIDLGGSPDKAAERIVARLGQFGRLEDGRESLELFLERAVIPKVDIALQGGIREIIKRCMIEPGSGPSGGGLSWPELRTPLLWPVADHSGVREAFARLLTRDVDSRFLPILGRSETGKTHVTKQMLANALRIPELACGRFDLKGTTGMDTEVRSFVQGLGVPVPPDNPRLNRRLGRILDDLKLRARPTLLVFDTYEAAGETQDWVEKELLPALIRATWLRVIIAGQRVPESAGAVWASVAHAPIHLVTPEPVDWFEYGRDHCPGLTLAWVEDALRHSANRISALAQILGPKA